ncbi:MAG: NYN domain-containing protein [Candidatus Omnitrophica bacterium]|nr:NYN domain-containing protein [Candidatus Omnitrophota bacterium]
MYLWGADSWLIIDGYNIINKWPGLIGAKHKSIGFAREKLNTIMQKYCDYKKTKVTIVYDGKGEEREVEKGNPEIIFSKTSETADSVIEYLAYNNKSQGLTVATDDGVLRNFIITTGVDCVSAKNLMDEVDGALSQMREGLV